MSVLQAVLNCEGRVGRWDGDGRGPGSRTQAERRAGVADARLEREFEFSRRRLVALARWKYRLAAEDCEEVAADALLAWHREVARTGGLASDSAFLDTVLRHRALDRKKRPTAELVELSAAEQLGADPQLDLLVAEREELADLAELVRDVLSPQELKVMLLSTHGFMRAEIAGRCGLSVRQVERWLERAQRKLDEGLEAMRVRGRCGMVALTVSDVKTGRIRAGDERYERGIKHLDRCSRCRATHPIAVERAA